MTAEIYADEIAAPNYARFCASMRLWGSPTAPVSERDALYRKGLPAARTALASGVLNAAPRRALDSDTTTSLDKADPRIDMPVWADATIGGAMGVRFRIPGKLESTWLEPQEAHDLARALDAAAQDAIHADRAGRR